MKIAPLAQLFEQQTLNLMVGGSIPLWRTTTIKKGKSKYIKKH